MLEGVLDSSQSDIWCPACLRCMFDMLCFVLDIMSQGSWRLLDELKDPDLILLANKLPNTVLHSRADSTVRKYLGAYRRWKTWANLHKLQPIPARPHELVLYLQYLAEHSKSKAAVEEACHALSWVHSSAAHSGPFRQGYSGGTTTVTSKASGQEGADHSADAGSYC